MIEMNEELRRNRQEIVTGLNMFLEENEEDDVSLEELEEEEFDVLEEEGTETISEDGSSKEAHNITRTPQKVSLRSISAMTDEEVAQWMVHQEWNQEDLRSNQASATSCVTLGKLYKPLSASVSSTGKWRA
ncbi:uncharacterized protein LOC144454542 isoform X2 [Phascolarctos cinereus]